MKTEDIIAKLGIQLNEMQQKVIEGMLHGKENLMVLSPTGSGKTLAYLLPLTELLDARSDEVQAVVVVPGRELALQSATVLKNMGSGLRGMACYGGRTTMEEHRKLREVKPQIVFATPGRLNDHLDKANILAGSIRYLILDEFDKCLEMGFHEEMKALLDKLPKEVRSVLLSATPAEELGDAHVVEKHFRRLDFLPIEAQVSERVYIYKVKSPQKDKLETLEKLLLSFGEQRSIVFLNHREAVERTAEFLSVAGFGVSVYHGGMEQKQREAALYKYANGSTNILVSTDLASRGLDIPDIDNIVHYHLPESEDGYIHRVGRTARWDKSGRAFFILNDSEAIPAYVDAKVEDFVIPYELPRLAQPKNVTLYIGKGKRDKVSKGDIVGFLCKKGGLHADEIGRIDVNERYSYVAVSRRKAGQVLALTKGEKLKGIKTVVEEVR